MSDAPDKHEKIHDPTPQRLRKAREDGNVFKSREVLSVGLLGVGLSVLGLGAPRAFETIQMQTASVFRNAALTPLNAESAPVLLTSVTWPIVLITLPFFGALFIAALGLNLAQTGLNVSTKALQPKGNRISPLQGLKRMFSPKGLFDFGKSVVKIVMVAPVAYLNISGHMPDIIRLHTQPLEAILLTVGGWIAVLLAQVLGLLALLSAVDFAWEKFRYKQDLMMTQQELKQEMKDSDGDPHMKGKRKQMAMENLRRPRLDHAVLQADVVVTNPTHYAIALKYDPVAGGAPRVLVKGIRKRALRIKGLALDNNIPTVENRPLARALYAAVDEQQEIPEDLYAAVAAVLAEVYRARGKTL